MKSPKFRFNFRCCLHCWLQPWNCVPPLVTAAALAVLKVVSFTVYLWTGVAVDLRNGVNAVSLYKCWYEKDRWAWVAPSLPSFLTLVFNRHSLACFHMDSLNTHSLTQPWSFKRSKSVNNFESFEENLPQTWLLWQWGYHTDRIACHQHW